MYTKTLLGLFYVWHTLSVALAVPVSGQSSNSMTSLTPDQIDQTMKDAVQTLLAGLIMKGNDLRAELQEEARALLEDPYPFDADTLSEVAELAGQEVDDFTGKEVNARDPAPADAADAASDDAAEDPSKPETRDAAESEDETRSLRSLADDTILGLKHLYARSEVPAATTPPPESHHKLSDFFHMSTLANIFGEFPMEPMVPAAPAVPMTPPVEPTVAVPSPAADVVPTPDLAPEVPPVTPEVVPPPEARSVDEKTLAEPIEDN